MPTLQARKYKFRAIAISYLEYSFFYLKIQNINIKIFIEVFNL
jgi:hypothetical protein